MSSSEGYGEKVAHEIIERELRDEEWAVGVRAVLCSEFEEGEGWCINELLVGIVQQGYSSQSHEVTAAVLCVVYPLFHGSLSTAQKQCVLDSGVPSLTFHVLDSLIQENVSVATSAVACPLVLLLTMMLMHSPEVFENVSSPVCIFSSLLSVLLSLYEREEEDPAVLYDDHSRTLLSLHVGVYNALMGVVALFVEEEAEKVVLPFIMAAEWLFRVKQKNHIGCPILGEDSVREHPLGSVLLEFCVRHSSFADRIYYLYDFPMDVTIEEDVTSPYSDMCSTRDALTGFELDEWYACPQGRGPFVFGAEEEPPPLYNRLCDSVARLRHNDPTSPLSPAVSVSNHLRDVLLLRFGIASSRTDRKLLTLPLNPAPDSVMGETTEVPVHHRFPQGVTNFVHDLLLYAVSGCLTGSGTPKITSTTLTELLQASLYQSKVDVPVSCFPLGVGKRREAESPRRRRPTLLLREEEVPVPERVLLKRVLRYTEALMEDVCQDLSSVLEDGETTAKEAMVDEGGLVGKIAVLCFTVFLQCGVEFAGGAEGFFASSTALSATMKRLLCFFDYAWMLRGWAPHCDGERGHHIPSIVHDSRKTFDNYQKSNVLNHCDTLLATVVGLETILQGMPLAQQRTTFSLNAVLLRRMSDCLTRVWEDRTQSMVVNLVRLLSARLDTLALYDATFTSGMYLLLVKAVEDATPEGTPFAIAGLLHTTSATSHNNMEMLRACSHLFRVANLLLQTSLLLETECERTLSMLTDAHKSVNDTAMSPSSEVLSESIASEGTQENAHPLYNEAALRDVYVVVKLMEAVLPPHDVTQDFYERKGILNDDDTNDVFMSFRMYDDEIAYYDTASLQFVMEKIAEVFKAIFTTALQRYQFHQDTVQDPRLTQTASGEGLATLWQAELPHEVFRILETSLFLFFKISWFKNGMEVVERCLRGCLESCYLFFSFQKGFFDAEEQNKRLKSLFSYLFERLPANRVQVRTRTNSAGNVETYEYRYNESESEGSVDPLALHDAIGDRFCFLLMKRDETGMGHIIKMQRWWRRRQRDHMLKQVRTETSAVFREEETERTQLSIANTRMRTALFIKFSETGTMLKDAFIVRKKFEGKMMCEKQFISTSEIEQIHEVLVKFVVIKEEIAREAMDDDVDYFFHFFVESCEVIMRDETETRCVLVQDEQADRVQIFLEKKDSFDYLQLCLLERVRLSHKEYAERDLLERRQISTTQVLYDSCALLRLQVDEYFFRKHVISTQLASMRKDVVKLFQCIFRDFFSSEVRERALLTRVHEGAEAQLIRHDKVLLILCQEDQARGEVERAWVRCVSATYRHTNDAVQCQTLIEDEVEGRQGLLARYDVLHGKLLRVLLPHKLQCLEAHWRTQIQHTRALELLVAKRHSITERMSILVALERKMRAAAALAEVFERNALLDILHRWRTDDEETTQRAVIDTEWKALLFARADPIMHAILSCAARKTREMEYGHRRHIEFYEEQTWGTTALTTWTAMEGSARKVLRKQLLSRLRRLIMNAATQINTHRLKDVANDLWKRSESVSTASMRGTMHFSVHHQLHSRNGKAPSKASSVRRGDRADGVGTASQQSRHQPQQQPRFLSFKKETPVEARRRRVRNGVGRDDSAGSAFARLSVSSVLGAKGKEGNVPRGEGNARSHDGIVQARRSRVRRVEMLKETCPASLIYS